VTPSEGRPGPRNALIDVPGLRIGHASRVGDGWLTGTTVVLAPEHGMVAAVDVRGGGPSTRETDALDPRNLVPRIDAIVLTGGSGYGLAAVDGVVGWLEEHRRGFPVGLRPEEVVPVVPAAALFDLGRGGNFRARPDAVLGREAIENAGLTTVQGGVGAGTGALAGGLRAGVGTASIQLDDDVVVAAMVVVNAVGSLIDPRTGVPYALHLGLDGEFDVPTPSPEQHARAQARLAELAREQSPLNTIIGVIGTNAALERSQAQKLAGIGHDGLARSVRPVHTLFDGDALFAVSTSEVQLPHVEEGDPFGAPLHAAALSAIYAAGADVVARAVVHALLAAEPATTTYGHLPTYRELYES
jgi:putative pantetheine hydrolase